MRFKVRGIYSTALTVLLCRKGFGVCCPSEKMAERMRSSCPAGGYSGGDVGGPPDISIFDYEGREGDYGRDAVMVYGEWDAVEEVAGELVALGAAVLRGDVGANSVYLAEVVPGSDGRLLDLGGGLRGTVEDGNLREGMPVIVSVERVVPGGGFSLVRGVRLAGKYAYLTGDGRVTISSRICDDSRRIELLNLGNALKREGWGIRWRSSAEGAEVGELIADVEGLSRKRNALLREGSFAKPPALLDKGMGVAKAFFPYGAKGRLDGMRGEMIPTISGHHFYKSTGALSQAVDLAEQELGGGAGRDTLELRLREEYEGLLPREGEEIRMEHVKLDGRVIRLRPGTVLEGGERYRVRREFSGGGVYDALGVPKEEGDYGIAEFERFGETITTSYYDVDGRLKGTYININTPVEVLPGRARYVDLEVDVVQLPGSPKRVVDRELLERAHDRRVIGDGLYRRALELAAALSSDK